MPLIGAAWVISGALILIIGAGALFPVIDPWIVEIAARQKALVLEAVERGHVSAYPLAAFHASVWVFAVILVRPLLMLGIVVVIETILVPGNRVDEGRKLAWTVRAGFLVISYLVGLALNRSLPVLPAPLFDFADAASPTGFRMLEMALLFLLSMLAMDFCQYWAHRAYHRFPILWKFHSVHHAPRRLNALHHFQHPVEGVASWFLIALPANLLITGVDPTQFSMLAAFFLVQNHLVHTNAPVHLGPLGRVLVDNRYHFIHHSRDPRHFNTNFAAVTPLFDHLFGTHRAPSGNILPETGLNDRLQPNRLSHYLLAYLPEDPPVERRPD
ncbi:MAG TPA: sterol desaturase family protein [Allosphingosinicella sp.]|nr:sterol desaturase family protein [Allosphingosinicella sp.]